LVVYRKKEAKNVGLRALFPSSFKMDSPKFGETRPSASAPPVSDTIPISVQGADCLTPTDRDLYESTLIKYILSLVYIGCAFLFLGFTAYDGMKSSYYSMIVDKGKVSGLTSANGPVYGLNDPFEALREVYIYIYGSPKAKDFQIQATGYSFACFCHFTAFFLAVSASIIISPWVTGTPNEKSILRSPKEFSS